MFVCPTRDAGSSKSRDILSMIQRRSAHLLPGLLRSTTFSSIRFASGDGPSRPPPSYPGHVPLNWFENAFLAAGSAVIGLVNPKRGGAYQTCNITHVPLSNRQI